MIFISGRHIHDRYIQFDNEDGPLSTVTLLNDLFLVAATNHQYNQGGARRNTRSYRELLSDMGNFYSIHGDFTFENAMISGPLGVRKIEDIVDWEHAGSGSEYWEYCKLLYGVNNEHEWHTGGCANEVLKSRKDEWCRFSEYSLWRGCP